MVEVADPMPASRAIDPPRRSLLRSALEYAFGSGLGLVGGILRVGVSARLLSPDERGLWLGLQMAQGYAQNLHLGVLYGLIRTVPMLKTRGDVEGVHKARSTSLGLIAVMACVGWLGLSLYLLLGAVRPDHVRHVVFTGVLTTVMLFRMFFVSAFKADGRFRDVSISATVGGVTSIVTIVLVWVAGLDGLIWGMTIQAMLEMAWLVYKDEPVGFRIDRTVLRGLLSVGLMTMGVILGTLALSNVDRTVMLARLGTTATGYYYIGANALVLLPAVAGLPADVLLPRFFEVFEKTGRGDALVPLVERPARAGAVLYAAFLGAIVLAVPPVVYLLWPNLVSGLGAVRVSILATFPVLMVAMVTKVFYAMNRQGVQMAILALSVGVGYGAASLAVLLVPTITGVAAGAAAGLFAYYVIGTLASYQLMLGRWIPGLGLLGHSFLPLVAASVAVTLCDRILGLWLPWQSFVRAALAEVFFCSLFIPWVLRSVRILRGIG